MGENLLFSNFTCRNCQGRKDPQFVFNSCLITLGIIGGGFLVAFAVNQYVREAFEHMTTKSQELQAKFNYMVLVTFFVIVLVFLLLYYLDGAKF